MPIKADTYVEGLQRVLTDITGLGTMADADLDFNTKLQTVVQGYIRQRAQATVGPPGAGAPAAPGSEGAPGGMPGAEGAPPLPPNEIGPGGGAGMSGLVGGGGAAPNADELRRVLAGGGAQ